MFMNKLKKIFVVLFTHMNLGKKTFFFSALFFITYNSTCASYTLVSLAEILASHPEISYIKCHDAESYEYESLPFTQYAQLRPCKGLMAETFVIKIPQGQVASYDGLVAIDNMIIDESLPPFFNHTYYENKYKNISAQEIKKIPGRVAVITTFVDCIYGHWLFNILARLALLEMSGIAYDYLYVPHMKKFQKEMLTLWGIDASKIIQPEEIRYGMADQLQETIFIQADEIIMPCHLGVRAPEPNQYKATYIPLGRYFDLWGIKPQSLGIEWGNQHDALDTIPDDIPLEQLFHQWTPFMGIAYYRLDVITYIRDKFLSLLKDQNYNFSKKVFISRKDSNLRIAKNEDEVFALFEQHGFVRYCLSQMPYLEQVALFYQAEVIVGAQGSGLLNILYCKKDITIIEIFQTMLNPDLYYLFQTLHLQTYIPIMAVNSSKIIDCVGSSTLSIDMIKNSCSTIFNNKKI